jgi:outer membrane protein assembly factor BamA
MYVTSKFKIGKDVIESARKAIKAAYEKNGYPPNEVMVHPETEIGNNTVVAVMLDGVMHQIPLRVRDDLKIGFRLADNEGLLDVCDPNSPFE